VDFKIVPRPAAAVSRSILRQQLGTLRARVTAALLCEYIDTMLTGDVDSRKNYTHGFRFCRSRANEEVGA
jgi:hypothetical protein